jgi:bifunctional UDP-N-acetylglucosamine pyrophosphorylase / glucosamine-1-phosphate N-acetyltransferase
MASAQIKSNSKLRAVVLAAGLGKRMQSSEAKVLHPVLGKAIIWRVLKALDGISKQVANLEQIHIVVGHNAQQVEAYVKQSIETKEFQCPIFFHKQEEQLGTGHALMSAQAALNNFQGNVLILPGDCPLLTSDSLNPFLLEHKEKQSDLTILSAKLENPSGYGRIVKTEQGKVLSIVEEKDASDKEKQIKEIGTSIYCFNWKAIEKGLKELKNDNKQGEYYLTDLIAWSVEAGHKVNCFSIDDWRLVMGVNSRLELQLANKFLNEIVSQRFLLEGGVTIIDPLSTWIAPEVKIESDTTILPGCWLIGDIQIGKSCIIGPHTSIEGKVQIGMQTKIVQSHLEDCRVGKACYIGPFAHLRVGTVLCDQVRIGNFVEIKMSTIDNLSAVSHLSYVGDTTVGKDSNIGAGTITANYDHITKIKASTIIEDGASIGSNSVLVAPVKIGKNAVVAAGTVITKDVDDESLAVRRVKQENIAGWSKQRRNKDPNKNKNSDK